MKQQIFPIRSSLRRVELVNKEPFEDILRQRLDDKKTQRRSFLASASIGSPELSSRQAEMEKKLHENAATRSSRMETAEKNDEKKSSIFDQEEEK